jgi:hypothetical protein
MGLFLLLFISVINIAVAIIISMAFKPPIAKRIFALFTMFLWVSGLCLLFLGRFDPELPAYLYYIGLLLIFISIPYFIAVFRGLTGYGIGCIAMIILYGKYSGEIFRTAR